MMDERDGAVARVPRNVRWTKAMKDAFLDHLAATAHVGQSAAAIGVDQQCLYGLRRRNAAFRAAWAEAVDQGYEMLETLLLGHVLAGGARRSTVLAARVNGIDPEPISVDLALKMLTAHRTKAAGKVGRPKGPQRRVASIEETDAAILAKLAAYDRRKARDAVSA